MLVRIKKNLLMLSVVLSIAPLGIAQVPVSSVIRNFAGAPTGACNGDSYAEDVTNGNIYQCINSVWTVYTAFKGPSPWYDATRYGMRATGTTPSATTATCNGTTAVTLAGAIDFINGDGIVLHQCGPASSLTTPDVSTAVINPKGILNGSTTRAYEVVGEDYSLGMTAASAPITIATSAASLGDTNVTISSATILNGILTVTTTANHNFENGVKIRISGASGTNHASFINQVLTVQSIPAANMFTAQIQALSGFAATASNGTVTAPAHNAFRWASQINILRWWIYRQDNGVGPFNLVGVAQGMEPFYDDFGFPAPGVTWLPEVPTVAPTVAKNQAIATTIVSGAGTTNIVVANAASSSVSGVAALHDNSANILAAITAATGGFSNTGGTIYIPNIGDTPLAKVYVINFPLKIGLASAASPINFQIAGQVFPNQPIIPAFGNAFFGMARGQIGSFSQSNYTTISGESYPLFLITGQTVTLDHLLMVNSNPNAHQAWTLLYDLTPDGITGPISQSARDVSVGTSVPDQGAVVMRGPGFNFLFKVITVASANSAATFYYPPAIRATASCVNPTFTGIPGDVDIRDIDFIGQGLMFDGDACPGVSLSAGGSAWTVANIFTESTVASIFDFRNISTSNLSNFNFYNTTTLADPVNIAAVFDMSNPTFSGVAGMRLELGQGGTGGAGILIGPTQANQVEVIGRSSNDILQLPVGSSGTVGFQANVGTSAGGTGVLAGKRYRTGSGIELQSIANVFFVGAPPTAVTNAISVGGAVPVGEHFYNISAVDVNGGESTAAPSLLSAITTAGNQTVTLDWVAPTTWTPVGYIVYRDGASVFASPLAATTFVDTAAVITGHSQPHNSGGGPVGGSAALGWWAPRFVSSGTLFANLGTPQNGTFTFCPDCIVAAVCLGGGTGAFAKRLNGAWVCN